MAWPRRSAGIQLFAALCYVNGVTFAFHVAVSRILGPSGYGALGAILVLTGLVGTATTAVGVAVTRAVATGNPAGPWDTAHLDRVMIKAAAAVLALGAVLSPGLERFLHLGSPMPVVFLAVLAAGTLLGVVPRGVLMGEGRFVPVSRALIAGSTVKLVLGAILAAVAGVSGGVAGAALGECVIAGMCTIPVLRQRGGPALDVPLRSVSLVTAAYAGFWLFVATDSFLARHLLGGAASGLYVAASTAGSIALFLPNNVTLAVFPALARNDGTDLRRPVGAVLGLTVLAAGLLALLPGVAVGLLFGPEFRASAPLLVWLAVANGLQGIAGFLQHHQLALHRRTALLPWGALVALAVAIYANHGSPHRIALDALAVSAGLVAVMATVSARLAARVDDTSFLPS